MYYSFIPFKEVCEPIHELFLNILLNFRIFFFHKQIINYKIDFKLTHFTKEILSFEEVVFQNYVHLLAK